MANLKNRTEFPNGILSKTPTGIRGLDEITGGGLPKGRLTLVCGSAGCGKSVGEVDVESEYGKGSVFSFFLPYRVERRRSGAQ